MYNIDIIMVRHSSTVNLHCGRKLSGKSKDGILEAIIQFFSLAHIQCVQQNLDIIRVTFRSEEHASSALRDSGIVFLGFGAEWMGVLHPLSYICLTILLKRIMKKLKNFLGSLEWLRMFVSKNICLVLRFTRVLA